MNKKEQVLQDLTAQFNTLSSAVNAAPDEVSQYISFALYGAVVFEINNLNEVIQFAEKYNLEVVTVEPSKYGAFIEFTHFKQFKWRVFTQDFDKAKAHFCK